MSTSSEEPTMHELLSRVAELEQAHTRLQEELTHVRAGRGPAVEEPARPLARPHSGRSSRRKVLRKGLGVAVATLGAGALLEGGSGAALASGPGSFSSSSAATPAVKATGTNGAKGVLASSDSSVAVRGTSTSGNGLAGISSSATGVFAQSMSGLGAHMVGGGTTETTPSFTEAAIFAEGGPSYGIYASNASSADAAIYATNSSGDAMHAVNTTAGRSGLYAEGGPGYGVYATGSSGTAIITSSSTGDGLHASSSGSGLGMLAQSSSGIGAHIVGGGASASTPSFSEAAIFAEGGPGYGLYATASNSTDCIFVHNTNVNSANTGLHAVASSINPSTSSKPAAIFAEGGTDYALYVTSSIPNIGSGYGVYAIDSGLGVAIYGQGNNVAVYGTCSTSGTAVYGNNSGNNGVAVQGHSSSNSVGVYGFSDSGTGVVGQSNSSYAGEFYGDVNVVGTLTKGGGSFQIDHPQDPAHKYLSHSFVESPDMKNIYDGVVTLDANGEAEITLPEWFSVLNRDFRYQLTCLGGYAPVYIAHELQDSRFRIAGGKSSMKVSWQVTGIRQDRWANAHRIPVEQDKSAKEQGYYLHPDLYGQAEEKSIYRARYPHLKPPAPVGT